ncbi:MAG: M48 family metallopeptidase [Rhodocyclaceae bacterium]
MIRILRLKRHAVAAAILLACLSACQNMPQISMPGASAKPVATWENDPLAALPPPESRTGWMNADSDQLNQRANGFGLVRMPDMQAYLNGLYAKIKTQAGVPNWPGKVFITASSTLDAFATGAGNLYISTAWLMEMRHEDELVALLGHEFGHVYLHYHQLEGAVLTADTAALVAALAITLAKPSIQGDAWTPVDTLLVGYLAGRSLSVAAWGRSQESAADMIGLNISLKLGYSYENGMKLMLERLAAQETKLAALKKAQEDQARAIRQQQQRDGVCKQAAPKNAKSAGEDCNAVAKAEGDFRVALQDLMEQVGSSAKDIANPMIADHPETADRLEFIAQATERLPDEALVGRMPDNLPRMRALPATAAILQNYRLAIAALAAPDAPDALSTAAAAAKGPTATHAMPLVALYRAQRANPSKPLRQEFRADPGVMMDANLKSAEDVSWIVVLERTQQLQAQKKNAQAKTVMTNGFKLFQQAQNVWPDNIRYTGAAAGWPSAKQLANDCQGKFPAMADACRKAAISPAEQAQLDRQSKEKGEKIGNDLVKKLSNK